MTEQHLMIDLETLASDANAVILTLGMVLVEDGHFLSDAYIEFDAQEQIDAGRKVSAGTIKWWLAQSVDAQRAAFSPRWPLHLKDALHQIALIQGVDWKQVQVWSNGADFDIPILYTAYHSLGMRAPWSYKNVRCFRTIKNLYPDVKLAAREGEAHNALDDARNQALHLIKLLNEHGYSFPERTSAADASSHVAETQHASADQRRVI